MGGQADEDLGELGWRFAFAENYFGHALAEGAVVVELGEAQVFEGEMAQALDGFVGGQLAFADLSEEIAERFGVHGFEVIVDGDGEAWLGKVGLSKSDCRLQKWIPQLNGLSCSGIGTSPLFNADSPGEFTSAI